jgi:hypothetical protein
MSSHLASNHPIIKLLVKYSSFLVAITLLSLTLVGDGGVQNVDTSILYFLIGNHARVKKSNPKLNGYAPLETWKLGCIFLLDTA